MSRFFFITLLAIVAFFAIGLSLHGATRLWVYTIFWAVYLTIVGCGVAFIQLQFFGPVICRGTVGTMRVALTFDDGPDPAVTPAVLDLLAREKIFAAFFCIGKNVATHPAIAARIVNEGHLIANHTFHHNRWTAFFGPKKLKREIELSQQAIFDAVNIAPIFMRPPVGLTNPHYARVLKKLGLTMIGWNVRSLDTVCDAKTVIARVCRYSVDGSIILLHDAGSSPERVVEIVSAIIRDLQSRHFEFERLDRLIALH